MRNPFGFPEFVWTEGLAIVDVPGWDTVWFRNHPARAYGVRALSHRSYDGRGKRLVEATVSYELATDTACAEILATTWHAEAEANL